MMSLKTTSSPTTSQPWPSRTECAAMRKRFAKPPPGKIRSVRPKLPGQVLDKLYSFIEAVQETAPTELSGRLRALAKLDSLISSMGSRVMPHCIGACGPRRSRMGDQPVTNCHRADASGSARNRRSCSRSESAHSSSAGCRAKATAARTKCLPFFCEGWKKLR